MAFELPLALEALVQQKIATGLYEDETAVVSSALELLELHDSSSEFRRMMLLAALDEGEADIQAGRYIQLNSPKEIREYMSSLTKRKPE
jgi:Arc/MetJ-type ribon-helix-helix transcriptional regulator